MPNLVNVPAAAGGASESTMEEDKGNIEKKGEEMDEPSTEKDELNENIAPAEKPNNEGRNEKVDSESNNRNIEMKGGQTDKLSIDEEGTAKAVSENDKPKEGAKFENTTESNTETNKRKYEQSNTSSSMKKKKEGDEMFNSTAKSTGPSMNTTSQQQAGFASASQQNRFVKISLKLPPMGSGKIGFILQDDKQHYGLPLLVALSPDSPYHNVIPPHLVGHYWVIGVKDTVIGESKILNSSDLVLELDSRRKKNEESFIEITFARKSGNANAVSLPSNPNLSVMLPSASQIPPQMMHPNQIAMMWQLAARHQNQLARAVPPNMRGQQLPAANNQANNKPVLPLRQKKQPKSSSSPETDTKAIRDSTIRRALSEFFVEGETRPLLQFCQAYPKLYTAIFGEVSKNTGLREIQGKRKTNEAFSKEDGRAAIHHINEMYSCDDHSKKRKDEHPDLLQRKKTQPLEPKDTCKGLQSTDSTLERDPTEAPLQNCPKQGTRQQQSAIVPCRGVYNGSFGAALSFAARTMLNTAHQLLQWAAQPDAGIQSFTNSSLATSRHMFLSYRRMTMERASTAQDGFVFYREGCRGDCSNGARAPRCDICSNAKRNSQKCVRRSHTPHAGRADPHTKIEAIANDPIKAKIEIEALRAEIKRLRRRLNENDKAVSREELKSANTAEDIFMV